jgi:hypothetical protein
VKLPVTAWALFRDGKYETVELTEYIELAENATAICDNEDCGHEWWPA